MWINRWWRVCEAAGGDGDAAGGEGDDVAVAPQNDQPPGDETAGKGGEKTSAPPAYWPNDWQTRVAKNDDKLLKRAQRYASPEAVFEALVAAQNRISSGELKTALPEKPSADELKAWRLANSIPESPEKYDLKFQNGLVIGEEDKPMIDEFLKAAHGANLTEDQAKGVIEWYYADQQRQADEQTEIDEEDRTHTLDALNVEWGGQFRRNINLVKNMLTRFPAEVRELLENSRLSDGTAMFNNPEVLRGFAALALELNPTGTVVAGDGDNMKAIDDEIKEIEQTMRTNRRAYNADEGMQKRYRELIGYRENLKKRA
jgi:hypothetical protein